MIFTGLIVLAALFIRDLNAIAPLITMFFLITYATVNLVVFIEQSLGLISFRPLLRVPRLVPLLGAIGCFVAMFIIAPVASLACGGTGVAGLRVPAAPPPANALWRRAQRLLRLPG